ncbi:SGNH/GDSL hydrolase family protein [Flavitalea antarctica]
MERLSFTYLALGDSYTAGEGVQKPESFPFQVVSRLNQYAAEATEGQENDIRLMAPPVIIAQTGWTTSELSEGIRKADVKTKFDVVTLLIGVNNQYRGLSIDDYGKEFEQLATKALDFASHDVSRVIVLSIPDWSATPFAAELDREKISLEIDRFNSLNRQISLRQGFHYVDITGSSRNALNDPSLVAGDQLHPSGKEYRKWCDKLVPIIAPIVIGSGWTKNNNARLL